MDSLSQTIYDCFSALLPEDPEDRRALFEVLIDIAKCRHDYILTRLSPAQQREVKAKVVMAEIDKKYKGISPIEKNQTLSTSPHDKNH